MVANVDDGAGCRQAVLPEQLDPPKEDAEEQPDEAAEQSVDQGVHAVD